MGRRGSERHPKHDLPVTSPRTRNAERVTPNASCRARHPELVSGSPVGLQDLKKEFEGLLKQVQHNALNMALLTYRGSRNKFGMTLRLWFGMTR